MIVYTRSQTKFVTRKELRFAAIFIMAHLVEEPLHNNLEIKVISRKPGNRLGLTKVADTKNFPRAFRIWIDPELKRTKQLITLSHELVHVKQLALGELGNVVKDKNGRTVTTWMKKNFVEDDADYWDWPWEIEANGREYGLYRRYLAFINEHEEFIK